MRDYLSLWKCDADGLVAHRKGGWDWADWGKDIDVRVLDQAWYCLALEGAANLARLAGKPDEASAYDGDGWPLPRPPIAPHGTVTLTGSRVTKGRRMTALTRSASSPGLRHRRNFPRSKAVLCTEYHASPYMEKYVLEALMLMGDPDAALARMKKRYGKIVDGPWTTLPELWDPRSGTHNHAWAGGPLTILSQYFAGLEPLAPAWQLYLGAAPAGIAAKH